MMVAGMQTDNVGGLHFLSVSVGPKAHSSYLKI